MHVILTGATGLVGSGVLDAMIKTTGISKISILSRRPVLMADEAKDPRVNVIIHQDFENYDSALLEKLKGAQGCVWALGVSQFQVGSDEYVKITKTFAVEAAKAFQNLASPTEPFNFVYVSGGGATTEPGKFSQIFARVKGETELALADLRKQNPHLHVSSVRPSFVDASAHSEIKGYIPKRPMIYTVMGPIVGPSIRLGFKNLHSPTGPLGKVLTEIAIGKHQDQFVAGPGVQKIGDFPILENSVLRRLAGLP